jgi:hypothetical protein
MNYDNTNRGVLFRNQKSKDTAPDYTGKINVDGRELRLAAWLKDGANGKFLSLTVSEPLSQTAPMLPPTATADLDDFIPF